MTVRRKLDLLPGSMLKHPAMKLAGALTLGLTATLACVAATAAPDAQSAEVHPLTTAAPGAVADGPAPADPLAADSGSPGAGCPHGALEDPHRGFVRCLNPGEKSPFAPADPGPSPAPTTAPSAGPAPTTPPSTTSAPSAGPAPTTPPSTTSAPSAPPAPAPTPETPRPPAAPPLVEMKTPKFENGDVPRVEKNLSAKKVIDAIAKCVGDAGGLTGKNASLKVEFLVRARGKAEGVEVTPTGVPAEAAKCVQTLLKNRSVGTPSSDPVGVTIVYSLKPAGK